MCSGTCFQILLLCLVFCLVECGKDPAKREIDSVVSNSSNKLEKGEKEEQVGPGKKFLVPDLETTQNGTSATFSITVSADGTLDDSNDDENPKKGLTEIPKPRPGFAYFGKVQISHFEFVVELKSGSSILPEPSCSLIRQTFQPSCKTSFLK